MARKKKSDSFEVKEDEIESVDVAEMPADAELVESVEVISEVSEKKIDKQVPSKFHKFQKGEI